MSNTAYSGYEREAMFYTQLNNGQTECLLCPHKCVINDGEAGFCGVRENAGGKLFAAAYGRVSSINLDPIEKKPLYMFEPGMKILSVGGFGCNLRCPFCQNSDISLEYENKRGGFLAAEYIAPERVVELAERTNFDGNIGVAYTYNEPFIGYEYLYDCAVVTRQYGLSNVAVTNGFINREPLETLLPLIDAMNIDLKGFTAEFYKNIHGGFETVKNTIELAAKHCHTEITTLVIPGENDSVTEISALAEWLASVNREIPLHLSRFFPRHKYAHKQPTPKQTIHNLKAAAQKHLSNVFVGNM